MAEAKPSPAALAASTLCSAANAAPVCVVLEDIAVNFADEGAKVDLATAVVVEAVVAVVVELVVVIGTLVVESFVVVILA